MQHHRPMRYAREQYEDIINNLFHSYKRQWEGQSLAKRFISTHPDIFVKLLNRASNGYAIKLARHKRLESLAFKSISALSSFLTALAALIIACQAGCL